MGRLIPRSRGILPVIWAHLHNSRVPQLRAPKNQTELVVGEPSSLHTKPSLLGKMAAMLASCASKRRASLVPPVRYSPPLPPPRPAHRFFGR